MNVHVTSLILIAVVTAFPFEIQVYSLQDFFQNQTQSMKAFFDEQRNKMEKAINNGYVEAVKMKNSVNDYVGEQQRRLSAEINNYVETFKDSGRKFADSWTYLPIDDPASKLVSPDVVLSVPAIIVRNGYACETHTVVSEGYILNIHRIPRAKNSRATSSKTVFLHHGLFVTSADWILNGPDKALAYVLADAGYDVWMANIRGNRYSREHAWLKTNSKSYWNFSWHDIALYDVPAVLDYIINLKGKGTNITYIGHSMGTTILFAMLCLRPEYNKILKAAIALAPEVFLSDIKSPLQSLASTANKAAYMEMMYGSYEFIPKNSALGSITSGCHEDGMDAMLCKNALFYICGHNEKQFNKTLLPVFLSHLGTGTSWKTAVHFSQEILAGGKFQQFDYGSNNMRVYGSDTPPEYDLGKVTLPITLFWSKNDLLSSEKDVRMLYERLPSTTSMYLVPDPEFNHLDYLWANDAKTLINEKVLGTLHSVYETGGQ